MSHRQTFPADDRVLGKGRRVGTDLSHTQPLLNQWSFRYLSTLPFMLHSPRHSHLSDREGLSYQFDNQCGHVWPLPPGSISVIMWYLRKQRQANELNYFLILLDELVAMICITIYVSLQGSPEKKISARISSPFLVECSTIKLNDLAKQ